MPRKGTPPDPDSWQAEAGAWDGTGAAPWRGSHAVLLFVRRDSYLQYPLGTIECVRTGQELVVEREEGAR